MSSDWPPFTISSHLGALIYGGLFVGGALLHITYLNHGEHHMYGASYLMGALMVPFMVALALTHHDLGFSTQAALQVTFLGWLSFFTGLFVSLTVYRTLLSPLCKFPGPWGARLSDFYFSAQCTKQDAFRQILKYHQTYGDFVRVGSNTISITHASAVDPVYGIHSHCRKADWYDLTAPMYSMQTARTKALHDQRRRIWSTAFSIKALRDYELRISKFQEVMISQISAFAGQPIDVAKWFNLYTFDVMGDLAFGADLQMLESRQEHWAIKLLNEGIRPLSFHLPIWFFRVMVAVPGLTRDWWRFIGYCRSSLEDRMRNKPEVPDIMSALLSSYGSTAPSPDDMQMLCGDSQLVIVAGSDTTSTTLTFLFYELIRHPQHLALLRDEILACLPSDRLTPCGQDLQHLSHLNAVINETLRLHPPVPTALPRLTPPEGLEINGTQIPGNTVVWCPQYAICRSESNFALAESFIPERWTTQPELIKQRGAFAPFSTGPYGCIGRPLALLNLRTTIARLILKFDVELPSGYEMGGLEDRTTEHFTLAPGELMMVFRERNMYGK